MTTILSRVPSLSWGGHIDATGRPTRRTKRPRGACAGGLVLLCLMGACKGQQAQLAVTPSTSATADAVRPGDKVRLKIWREPDLSGDFDVDESGQVLLPKIGPFDVGSLSADSAKRAIVTSYAALLRNPTIDVLILRRINVLGAVRTPGLYPVDPTMTVADVLALAGGPSPDGKPDQVRLLRNGQPLTVRLNAGTRISETPIRGGDQLYVPQRGWVSRNAGLVIGTALGITGIVIRLASN
jgi:protein involved in polysaccharide export with SLBB domain